MSSSCGSVCLLVLFGVVFAFGSPVHKEDLDQIHESIQTELELKNPLISGHSPFESVVKNVNISCMRKEDFQLINLTLDVYQRIFSSILDNPETPSLLGQVHDPSQVKQHLLKLQKMTEEKKKHLNHANHNTQKILMDLHGIQVDNPVVQKKALSVFREVYKLADLVDRRCGQAH